MKAKFLTTCGILLMTASIRAQTSYPAKLEVLTMKSSVFSNTRSIRVWLPQGYYDPKQLARRYPVFYFTDGIAVFQGRHLEQVTAKLIASGKIPPIIFVGIDNGGSTAESKHPGSDRANEYLPYPDDSLSPPLPSPQGKRFPDFLEKEVRPLVESKYRATAEVGLAGSSYGGAIAVYTVMERPRTYRWLLLESPSLYVGDNILLKRAAAFHKWPARVYVGAGTDEGEGEAKLEMVRDAKSFVRALGSPSATCLVIASGAKHNEEAWSARLPGALEFLLGSGKCPASK